MVYGIYISPLTNNNITNEDITNEVYGIWDIYLPTNK